MPYTRTLAAAAVALIAASATLGAQDTTRTDTTRRESRGDVAMAPSFERLKILVDSAPSAIAKINASPTIEAANVRLVDVATLLEGKSPDELHSAIERNQAAIDSLRAAITANAAISGALAGATPVPVTNVIAADVSPTGEVVIYHYKKPEGQ
jgi:hypothetical protein